MCSSEEANEKGMYFANKHVFKHIGKKMIIQYSIEKKCLICVVKIFKLFKINSTDLDKIESRIIKNIYNTCYT